MKKNRYQTWKEACDWVDDCGELIELINVFQNSKGRWVVIYRWVS